MPDSLYATSLDTTFGPLSSELLTIPTWVVWEEGVILCPYSENLHLLVDSGFHQTKAAGLQKDRETDKGKLGVLVGQVRRLLSGEKKGCRAGREDRWTR